MTLNAVSHTTAYPGPTWTMSVRNGLQPWFVRLTFGGVDAPVWPRNGILVTNPPWREPGTVDVMVTNPDGSSVALAAGFTYKAATLELSKADVGAGESLVVTWSGPPDPSDFTPPDVIGLSAVDDPSKHSALAHDLLCRCCHGDSSPKRVFIASVSGRLP